MLLTSSYALGFYSAGFLNGSFTVNSSVCSSQWAMFVETGSKSCSFNSVVIFVVVLLACVNELQFMTIVNFADVLVHV